MESPLVEADFREDAGFRLEVPLVDCVKEGLEDEGARSRKEVRVEEAGRYWAGLRLRWPAVCIA
jgi:hypothetical protein